jgi:hypothetical protein
MKGKTNLEKNQEHFQFSIIGLSALYSRQYHVCALGIPKGKFSKQMKNQYLVTEL